MSRIHVKTVRLSTRYLKLNEKTRRMQKESELPNKAEKTHLKTRKSFLQFKMFFA